MEKMTRMVTKISQKNSQLKMLKMSQIIVSNKVVLLKMVKNKKKEGKITYKKKRKPRRIKLNLVN